MSEPTIPLAQLRAAGFALDALTDDQLDVLRALSTEELELLLDLKHRLDDAGPEVQAHSEIAGGALF
ncbi:aroma-sacti cluster domain-containing protein [Kitasatospora sp. NPDC004240]